MFSGELVDTRSDAQKKKDQERSAPLQIRMFSTPEMVQGGQSKSVYREWLNQATAPPLELAIQDMRTPEEIERDEQREAEKLTVPLFEVVASELTEQQELSEPAQPSSIIFDAQHKQNYMGLRKKLRANQISGYVRQRSA